MYCPLIEVLLKLNVYLSFKRSEILVYSPFLFIVVIVAFNPGVKSLSQSLNSRVFDLLVRASVSVMFLFSLSLIG